MTPKKDKKKNIFNILIKNAVKFIGSTVGIVKEDEETLPLELYPVLSSDNIVLRNETEDIDLKVSDGDGEVPLWMRNEHAPRMGRRKLKRKIYRVIKERNRMLKLIKRNELRTERYTVKLNKQSEEQDELYRLRKQYVESVIDNREIESKLKDTTNDYLKYRLLSKLMGDTADKEIISAEYNSLKDEIRRLRSEIERIKSDGKPAPNELIRKTKK
ncbi:MAG: hypothetical protein ACOX3U_00850 [Christensenellales bacterium]|jgi:hypothetical protein